MARRPGSLCWLVSFLILVGVGGGQISGFATHVQAKTVGPLFDSPLPTQTGNEVCEKVCDEVLLVSTREIGTVCSGQSMRSELSCQRLVSGLNGSSEWKTSDWRRLLSSSSNLPTIVYVHGNRVSPGKDQDQGIQVYHSLKANSSLNRPLRFIIWSWPSSRIPRPVKDYLVKAQRTHPAAWQLAWLLDKLPVDAQISLVGYSYGTRVIGGAAHLLAGGRLGQLKLEERIHPQRPTVRVALIAAAFDADWVQPGEFYGRSLGQLERLVLTTNKQDPVMRFYHLSNGRGRMHALGKAGVHQPRRLGDSTRRLQLVDFSHEVGRSHALADYLGASEKMRLLWHELLVSYDPAMVYVSPELVTIRDFP